MLKVNSDMSENNSPKLAKNLARIIDEKKGEDIVIFDLRGISPIADFFVIASGLSDLHIQATANYIIACETPSHTEGMEAATWVLLDFIDVIVHLFSKEAREFYGLERLWGDAPRLDFKND